VLRPCVCCLLQRLLNRLMDFPEHHATRSTKGSVVLYVCRPKLHLPDHLQPCYVGPCHHGMARPRIADGGYCLQIRSVAANILN
jgi:hypothetical protein